MLIIFSFEIRKKFLSLWLLSSEVVLAWIHYYIILNTHLHWKEHIYKDVLLLNLEYFCFLLKTKVLCFFFPFRLFIILFCLLVWWIVTFKINTSVYLGCMS